jgi:Spy/CpxP family protein refolding chaperone
MKKIFALLVLLSFYSAAAVAQTSPNLPTNQEELLQRTIRVYKAPLVEKAKITEAQADKVVAIIAEIQGKMRDLGTGDQLGTGEDRMKKLEALRAERDKKFKAIPLSDEEMKNVSAAIDEIRKNMQTARPGNN